MSANQIANDSWIEDVSSLFDEKKGVCIDNSERVVIIVLNESKRNGASTDKNDGAVISFSSKLSLVEAKEKKVNKNIKPKEKQVIGSQSHKNCTKKNCECWFCGLHYDWLCECGTWYNGNLCPSIDCAVKKPKQSGKQKKFTPELLVNGLVEQTDYNKNLYDTDDDYLYEYMYLRNMADLLWQI